jgi:hypothetical protein
VVNTKGATSNICTLYDNNAAAAAGNVIAVIDTTNAAVGDIQFFSLNTTKGLVAVTATGTAADLTIIWE